MELIKKSPKKIADKTIIKVIKYANEKKWNKINDDDLKITHNFLADSKAAIQREIERLKQQIINAQSGEKEKLNLELQTQESNLDKTKMDLSNIKDVYNVRFGNSEITSVTNKGKIEEALTPIVKQQTQDFENGLDTIEQARADRKESETERENLRQRKKVLLEK